MRSNLLKPALQGGKLRCMGSTTYKEYRQHFEKDRALSRRFQKIDVNEPSVEDAIKILKGPQPYFEDHHSVKYTADAIKTAVELSARYINDRKLPDKAIDVIDEAGAAQAPCGREQAAQDHRRERDRGCRGQDRPHPAQERQQGRCRGSQGSRSVAQARRLRPGIRRSRRCPRRSSWRAPACASPKSRSATTCSQGRRVVGKTEVAKQLADTLGVGTAALPTCRNTWRSTPFPAHRRTAGLCRLRPGRASDRRDPTSIRNSVLLLDEIEEGAPGRVQHPPAGDGSRHADRPQTGARSISAT